MNGFSDVLPFFTWIRDFWYAIPAVVQSLIVAVFGIAILITAIRVLK